MNAFGIIFSDSYSQNSTHELTRYRSGASLPVGCRFRGIDFILSSLVNADIYTVGLLTKQNYASLVDHLDGGKNWDLDRKKGGLTVLSPYSRGETAVPTATAGKLDALRTIAGYIKDVDKEYVIIGQGNMVANLDIKDILTRHIESEADITLVCAEVENPGEHCMAPTFGEDGLLTEVRFSNDKGKYMVCLNCYCMRKDFLISFIEKANVHGWRDLNRDLVVRHMDSLHILGYIHKGYAAMLDTVAQYFKCNLDMLDADVREDLFNAKRPIITHIHDTVPTQYTEDPSICNTLLADGCEISGNVSDSVIFRKVSIGEGAVIENCVIMQGAVIGKNAVLKNVICDKHVVVSDGAELIGSPAYPYVLRKGAKV
ncbi:MAG: glucose-1-phosphate adenylyltransferase subunit GlgD [Clostridia bacterium]|nr:glucose-1-phosphate adenylyltransferase subunit GlgD [Clostridia bacterium]